MFRNIAIFSSRNREFSWWWLGIKVGVVTALIVWWWLENQNKKFLRQAPPHGPGDEPQSIPLPEEDAMQGETLEPPAAPSAKPDDLTKIEGIGPKIGATLKEAGITTFSQLAAAEPAALKQILIDGGIRIGYPDTWPEQAALAAKADWDALKELQSGLQGGRRVAG